MNKKANKKEVPVNDAAKTVKTEVPNAATAVAQEDVYNVEIIEDRDGKVDPTYLANVDPNYAYRYIRDEFKNVSMKTSNLLYQAGGWQIVPKAHLLKIGIKEERISPDGLYRVGDLILARMPRELYEKKEKFKIEKANRPVKQIERLLKKGDNTVGGKDIHNSMKGIQTAEDLGMK